MQIRQVSFQEIEDPHEIFLCNVFAEVKYWCNVKVNYPNGQTLVDLIMLMRNVYLWNISIFVKVQMCLEVSKMLWIP